MRNPRPFKDFISVLCVFLLINNLNLVPVAQADIPDNYTWQVERVEQSTASIVNGFVGGDMAFVWEDIPPQFFPLKITEVWVWWSPPPSQTSHHLAARVHFYRGSTGELKYILEHVALMRGLNRIRLAIECTECEAIFEEDEGPGVGLGIQLITEYDYPVTSNSGHIVVDNEGCWSETNLVYDYASSQWLDPCTYGMMGNFAIRAVFEPLCPERIGDIDGDLDIDLRDFQVLQTAFTGLGADVFGDWRVYSDLDNDYAITLDDFGIMAANFTGPDNDVDCPDFGRGAPPADSRLQLFSPERFPDVPRELQQVSGEVEPNPLRWTYMQIGVTLAIGAILLTFVIGPCVSSSCRVGRRADFATSGSYVTSFEEQRLQEAIDHIGVLGYSNEDAQWCYWHYSQPGWYNPQLFGLIRINHAVSEDETEFAATHVLGHVTIHHTFIDGEHWDQWGRDGVVLLLFAEWQHMEQMTWSERQCQEWLMQWRQQVGFENVAPEFGHGFGD